MYNQSKTGYTIAQGRDERKAMCGGDSVAPTKLNAFFDHDDWPLLSLDT
jgi:hypothetical protein